MIEMNTDLLAFLGPYLDVRISYWVIQPKKGEAMYKHILVITAVFSVLSTNAFAKTEKNKDFRKPASVQSGEFFCNLGPGSQLFHENIGTRLTKELKANCNVNLPFSVSSPHAEYTVICCTAL